MSTPAAGAVPLLPPGRIARREVGYWAMIAFCLSEAALFAYLLTSYFYLGVYNPSWPPAGVERPRLVKPIVMTVLLLSSSVVLVFGERGRRHGARTRYLIAVAVTMLLGLGFLALQGVEYHDKLQHMPPRANAYASIFYLITGFHGTHVALGIVMLAWTALADLRRRLSVQAPLAVRNTSFYWHFVDGVWLVIFTSLYLSPRWYR